MGLQSSEAPSSGILKRQLCGRERKRERRASEGGRERERHQGEELGIQGREGSGETASKLRWLKAIDSFLQGCFVLSLNGVGKLLWECPGVYVVWVQLGTSGSQHPGRGLPCDPPAQLETPGLSFSGGQGGS